MRKEPFLTAILFLFLLGAMALAPALEQPAPVRSENRQGQFDAVRAKERLAYVLGREQPHPADSPADDAVRERLVLLLERMGLNPVVRDQKACNALFKQRGISCARVRNVIATIGPRSGKALLINAHYDSVAAGPGASDDGIGVATALEVGSILAKQPLRRPIILLFNEGEELGLIGARAFLGDPLSLDVDSLINLEARGVEGPVNMFETSRPNSAAVSLFGHAVQRPTANSLSTDVYQLMPNYTDVNSFAERNWLTLNLAPIGNETRYHSPGDDLSALKLATLQHMGDQTLALAEHLSTGTPEARPANRIFMDVASRLFISIPLALGLVLLIGQVLVFALLSLSVDRPLARATIVLATLTGSALLSLGISALVGALRPGMFWRAHPFWTHEAAFAAVLFVTACALARLGRTLSLAGMRSMFWLIFLGVGLLIAFVATGGIIVFIIPPLLVLAGTAAARWWKPAETIGSLAAILFLYLTWGGMLGLLEELLDGGPMWIFSPLSFLLLFPALVEAKVLIDKTGFSKTALLSAIPLAGFWFAALAVPAYSADRQERFTLEYVTDAGSGKSWWSLMNDGAPPRSALGPGWTWGKLTVSGTSSWNHPAPPEPKADLPSVRLLSQSLNGGERTILVRIVANGNDEVDLVAPPNAGIRSAGIGDFVEKMDANESGKYFIGCSGRSCDGWSLEITSDENRPIHFLLVGIRRQLPGFAAPLLAAVPRFARPQYRPNQSLTFARVSL